MAPLFILIAGVLGLGAWGFRKSYLGQGGAASGDNVHPRRTSCGLTQASFTWQLFTRQFVTLPRFTPPRFGQQWFLGCVPLHRQH